MLPNVDIFICDENEACNLTMTDDLDAAADVLLGHGPGTVIIKQGAHGSTLYQPGQRYHQPSVMLGEVVDTIGAGDAYCAGFIYATLQGWPMEQRTAFASTAAGFTVLGVGGTDTFTDLASIIENMPII